MSATILVGDVRERLRDIAPGSVQLCITSPPYWALRSYLAADDPRKVYELGQEPTPDAFVATLVEVFAGVWPVLRDDGLLVVNLGDSYASGSSGDTKSGFNARYFGRPDWNDGKQAEHGEARADARQARPAGLKPKDLALVPARFALAMQAAGWTVRSVMPWVKANPMPESVTDRPTTAHEWIMLFSKQARYYWDADAVRRPQVNFNVSGSQHNINSEGIKLGRKTNPNGGLSGVVAGHANGRNFRTSDIFHAGLDDAIAAARSHLAALEAVRDRGGLWTDGDDALATLVNTQASSIAHYAMWPEKLVEPFIKAATRAGDTVLDPFCGTGTTLRVAIRHGRTAIGIDLDPRADEFADVRLNGVQMEIQV